MSNVLVSPLNWGLGHATRDIPVIKNLLDHHHEVTIAASGNARSVLEQEFPGCRSIDFPDYPLSFSAGRFFLPKFVASFPLILKAISDERKHLERIVAKDPYDLIISDNRLGVYSSEIPSVFITHQLHYHLPFVFWPAELLALALNGFHHGKYLQIVVPDNLSTQTALAGKLSRPGTGATKRRVYFSGILTSIHKRRGGEDLDYLVMVSGPEPQRTRLQEILLDQIPAIEGKRVVLLGSPGDHTLREQSDACRIIPYASTGEKEELMNRAQFIICRSGYTSMMEIAELGKRHALFIPTPGQTEQEYLSWYYEKKGWFHSKSQYRLSLPDDIRTARQARYTGFPDVPKTEENVTQLYDEVFAQYLER